MSWYYTISNTRGDLGAYQEEYSPSISPGSLVFCDWMAQQSICIDTVQTNKQPLHSPQWLHRWTVPLRIWQYMSVHSLRCPQTRSELPQGPRPRWWQRRASSPAGEVRGKFTLKCNFISDPHETTHTASPLTFQSEVLTSFLILL